MKHIILYVFVILILSSCASTKTMAPIATPVGDWDYSISGTPDGDFKGILNITSAGEVYSAKMISSAGTAPLSSVAYNKETKKITGQVPYNEYMVDLDATLAGDELLGSMSAGGMSFPFKATRKK
jgi:hypothetical protein